ncbi:MAG: hypothetical protein IKO25_09225 [Clostridia bacterium]|nr:hypothetical protein [Clostridia bacterium]
MDKIPSIYELMGLNPEDAPQSKSKSKEPDPEDPTYEIVKVKKTMTIHRARRINSECALEQSLPWHFEAGVTYHCISCGDVDSLTYFRVILKQQKVRYAIISTWCMALEDIKEIGSWLDSGYIDRIDFFCGEIFRGTYTKEYNELKALCRKHGCKMSIFRNHSKVMVIYGERFNAVIESSANVNTNPRTEQTAITLNDELCNFYLDFFNGIKSFEREFDNVKAWNPTKSKPAKRTKNKS